MVATIPPDVIATKKREKKNKKNIFFCLKPLDRKHFLCYLYYVGINKKVIRNKGKKTMKKILLAIVAGVLLCNCASTPKTVKCINGNKYILVKDDVAYCGACSIVRAEIFYKNMKKLSKK